MSEPYDRTQTCPICTGPAGDYRLGACSVKCDQVMGQDTSFEVVALAALIVIFAVVGALLLSAILNQT